MVDGKGTELLVTAGRMHLSAQFKQHACNRMPLSAAHEPLHTLCQWNSHVNIFCYA